MTRDSQDDTVLLDLRLQRLEAIHNQNSSTNVQQVLLRGIAAILVLLIIGYALISGIAIPDVLFEILVILLLAFLGLDGAIKFNRIRRNRNNS